MAGHSQFKNIMYRKGAQDAKRAKMFGKLIRELTVSARSGLPDPNVNPRLRAAIAAARQANMPKDTIERAIRRGTGEGVGEAYEAVRYEGFAVGGVAVIVEGLTDNRNRTAAEVRAAFSKHGGAIGEAGSVGHMFNRRGVIRYPAEAADPEAMFEAAVEAGAEDVAFDHGEHVITCPSEDVHRVRDALARRFGDPQSAGLEWLPLATMPIEEEQARTLLKMIEILEDNDDVQSVAANYEMPEAVLEKLSA